jgi:alkylation response protein AidB-like acyl-CoA dehydrogenase
MKNILARMMLSLEGSRALLYRTCALIDRNRSIRALLARGEASEAERANWEGIWERNDVRIRLLTPLAKYLATECAVEVTRAAIQVHGGIGFMADSEVGKLHSDAIITTIYEGTSEILEWTIARDRWQEHLKSRGAFFRDWAARLKTMDASAGAPVAALAMASLGSVFERCRVEKLTRNQHVLFRLGELCAWAETAAIFCERAVSAPSDASGLDAETLRILARIHAREAALKVATDGLRWVTGGGSDLESLGRELELTAIYQAQQGLLDDMGEAANKLNQQIQAAA